MREQDSSPKPTTFGEFLLSKSEEMGITQAKIASGAGLSQSYVSKVLRGKIKEPSATALLGILRVVGVESLEEVIDFFKDPEERELDEKIKASLLKLGDEVVSDCYFKLKANLLEKRFFFQLLGKALELQANAG